MVGAWHMMDGKEAGRWLKINKIASMMMAKRQPAVLPLTFLLLLLLLTLSLLVVAGSTVSEFISRADFPSNFTFGAGTSAYQYEGAVAEDGRAPSIWDTYTHEGFMADGSTGDIAADGYHRYKEDVKHMSDTGLEGYRFSISWSRLIPNGRGAANTKAIQYYNNLINELIKHGIQPHVTIYHLDFPQVLQDEYGGWISPQIIDDFKEFSDTCFREFGDRVLHWTTINEPNFIAMYSFDFGLVPPQRCSYPFGEYCRGGNSSTEPYTAAHHMILAHSAAVELYKTKYQAKQKGKIGLNLATLWYYPLSDSIADEMAAQRTLDFMMGWFFTPIVYGDYPKVMRAVAGARLPSFTKSQSEKLKGAFDFLGINYYSSVFVADNSQAINMTLRDMNSDMLAKYTAYKDKEPIGKIEPPMPPTTNPEGIVKLLKYLKAKYGNPPIYIQENGYGVKGEAKLHDEERISYLSVVIGGTLEALRGGSDIRGYFVWSFVDVFEYTSGSNLPMGLYWVDYENGYKRLPRLSAIWYSNFLKNGGLIEVAKIDDSGPRFIQQASV